MAKFHYMIFSKEPEDIRYVFYCPGCKCGHYVRTKGQQPVWQFNGDVNKPTVNPSILVQSANRCHSFVRDGLIRFLDDCSHELKGQTVEIPEFDVIDGEKY